MTNNAPPILLGLATATFLATAEAGGFLQSLSRKTSAQTVKVYDISQGTTVGKVVHDFMAAWSVRVITTVMGTAGLNANTPTGVPAAAPGVVIVFANTFVTNGVTTGGIYTTDTTFTHNAGQLQEFSMDAEQYPNLA